MATPGLVLLEKGRHEEEGYHNAEQNANELKLLLLLTLLAVDWSMLAISELNKRREALNFVCV